MADPLTTSAISWGFSAAGWLISPVLSRFLNKCFDALGMDPPPKFQSRKQILLAKLGELQTTLLPKLLILTDAAQKSEYRPVLEKWIQKLRSAFYEAEHVLGLVEYERLEEEVNSLFPSTSKFNFKNLKVKLPKFSSEKKNLIASLENMEKVVNEGMKFVNLLNLASSVNNFSRRTNIEQHSETISTPVSTVVGRDQDRDEIVKLLRDVPDPNNEKCYSVIGIWGMGGSGKTTLAQYVCEFERKKIEESNDKHFDLVIWAHVSQQFSVHAIWERIWESAFKEACPFRSLEGLRFKLEEKLRGQMFFLVLDDVWCDKGVSEKELKQLFAPLRAGKKGSKILVTTRIEEAAKTLGVMNPIPLRELDEDQFFSLFMRNALGNTQIRDNRLNDKLTLIGKEIAARLHRSPLAANTVAGQLRRRPDADFWSSMLDRSLLNDTMGALFLSYQHLPYPLQRCFAFCSLFPKGHEFDHDHLVNLWIAEGFIETEDTNGHIKDIANRYILELVSCSFFQVSKWGSYSMHDLMHDLAQQVSQSECFRIESAEKKKIPIQTRYLYIVADMLEEYVERICKLKDLCTIVVSGMPLLKEKDLDAIFNKLRNKLYVVELPHIESLTKSLIHLKNLRYLSIEKIEQADAIPETINRLYQLRALICMYSPIAVPDVGRLLLLQDLRKFHVRKRRGFELNQLEHLSDLFGTLKIHDLHNVERKEEARQVKLSNKTGLKTLCLHWDHESEVVLRDNDVEILDSLCPPPQIKELVIEGYRGKRLPSWILENNNSITHLKRLELCRCNGLESLPKINELSNLQSVTISGLHRLKSWVLLPLILTKLEISHFLSLAFALKEDLEMIMSVRSMLIPQIVTFANNNIDFHLRVQNHFRMVEQMIKLGDHIDEQALSTISNDLKSCLEKRIQLICQLKNICGVLYLPPALKTLEITSCFITDKVLAGSLQGLNSLTYLELRDIITITFITDEVLSSMTSLRDLRIKECLLLKSIGGWDNHKNLEELHILYCPNLTLKASAVANNCNRVELASSSCRQKISSCALKCLRLTTCMPSDDSFQNLVSLKDLVLVDCPTIVNPHISNMKSLTHLRFHNCPNLTSLRGLSEFNHLQSLYMIRNPMFEYYSDADKATQLQGLAINKVSQLEQLISRDGFSSLVSLTLYEAEQEYFSQEECQVLCNLSYLESIHFYNCEMRVLPNLLGFHTLTSVKIWCCHNLTHLSELPPSVQSISIYWCNEDFKKSCSDPKDPNCQKILHIPRKDIY